MVPTLRIGDLILVNKFHYGIRLPVINKKVIDNHDPERGDVVVFRYPLDPSTPFIKRIVGLPGDTVRYQDKTVYIGMNGGDIPVGHGGPLRLRAPRQLGYKNLKFLNRLVVTDSLDAYPPKGKYSWYAGI